MQRGGISGARWSRDFQDVMAFHPGYDFFGNRRGQNICYALQDC